MKIPLLSGAYKGISVDTSSQEAINFFYEAAAPGEGHQGSMVPVHGAVLIATLDNLGEIRTSYYNPEDELLYVVSGDTLYEVDSSYAFTNRGTLTTASGIAKMALNSATNELMVVDGTAGYIFNTVSNVFTQIVDPNFPVPGPGCVEFMDGYFLIEDPSVTGRFRWSGLNAGLTWPDNHFSTVESIETPVAQIIVDKRVLYLLGNNKGELWYNTGDVDDTFARFEYLETGSLAARVDGSYTAQKFDNSVVWISRNKRGQLQAVRAGAQYQPEVISTPEISRAWQALGSSISFNTYAYQIDGHEFFVVSTGDTSPSLTYAYDATTKLWHQRSGAFSADSPTRELVRSYSFCERWMLSAETGEHIVGDYRENGKLYRLSRSLYTWDEVPMERRITGPKLEPENEARLRFSEVHVDAENTGSGTDPSLILSWSKDGGRTFSAGRTLDLDADRMVARKLGFGRSWIFRIYTNSPNKVVIAGAYGRTYMEPFTGIPAQ